MSDAMYLTHEQYKELCTLFDDPGMIAEEWPLGRIIEQTETHVCAVLRDGFTETEVLRTLEEDRAGNWRCIKLIVTKTLTLMIAFNKFTGEIQIYSPHTLPIEIQGVSCLDYPDRIPAAEIFNDVDITTKEQGDGV